MYDDRSQPGYYSRKRSASREDGFNKRPRDDRRGSGGFKKRFQDEDARGDPYKLDYLVTLKQFQEYFTRNSRSKVEVGDEELLKRFNVYKENFTRKQNEKFFLKSKDSEWFREKYHPDESLARKEEIRNFRKNLSVEFENGLKNGEFDSVSFDAKEIKENSEEKENMTLNEKYIDLSGSAQNVLFITKIPDYVKRVEIEDLLRQKTDFERLILSDPRIEKNMTRTGWILFRDDFDSEEMCKQLDNIKIGNFSLHIVPNIKFEPKVRILPSIMSSGDRVKVDLEQAKLLSKALDREVGILEDSGVSVIDQWMELDVGDDEVKKMKKFLDLIIYYLMKVHQYDYYGGVETDSVETFVRRVTISLRPLDDTSCSTSEAELFAKELDSRIDLRINLPNLDDDKISQLGGRSLTRVLDGFLASYVKKESETKHRCAECQKLFKGDEYVKKHLKTKHPELVKTITTDTIMFNLYMLDPNKVDPVKIAAPRDRLDNNINGSRTRDFSRRDGTLKMTGRSDPRQIRSYEDLDAPADGDVELSYD